LPETKLVVLAKYILEKKIKLLFTPEGEQKTENEG